MMSPRSLYPKVIFCLLTVFCAGMWPTIVVADAELSEIVVNSRIVLCDPPGRYDGETAYIPMSFISRYLGVTKQRIGADAYVLRAYSNVLWVTIGQSTCQLNEQTIATKAVQQYNGEVLVPTTLLVRAFNIRARIAKTGGGPRLQLTLPGGNVENVRLGRHPDRVRVVLDLDQPAGYVWSAPPGTVVVEVAKVAGSEGQQAGLRLLTFDNPVVPRIAQSPTSDGFTRVVIARGEAGPLHIFTLADPPRIVVDVALPPPPQLLAKPQPPAPPKPGAGQWQQRSFRTPRGPVTVYVLKINPAQDGLQVRPVLAGDTVHSRRPVLQIARSNAAIAALNGGFFARQGPPLGLLIVDGEWVKHPIMQRTALGITSDGELLMERLSFDGRLSFERHGYLRLDGINRGHIDDYKLVVYTPRWGKRLEGDPNAARLVVEGDGRITVKEAGGAEVEIPPDGYAISGKGRYAQLLGRVKVGEAVTMKLVTIPEWSDVIYAIGGGPRLVKDGRPHVTSSPERFRSDISGGQTSRSALAITSDGGLMLVAVETPPDEPGDGMTLAELAQTLVKLGAQDAMNLDGGGSVTVVQGNRVINNPHDGVARAVSNALIVVHASPTGYASQ